MDANGVYRVSKLRMDKLWLAVTMARSDLLVNLIKAGAGADRSVWRKTVEAIIAEERAKQHHVLADRIERELLANVARENDVQRAIGPMGNGGRLSNLIYEIVPRKSFEDLLLPESAHRTCRDLVEEHNRAELLRGHNLEPRNRVLLVGPPGNGKTSLGEAIATAMMVPLIVVRYEGIVGSFLGETAARLRTVFDYVRSRRCVLFFDEFDTLGKERGDPHDTGEIKRVVSSLLLQIDDLPSHVVVVAATNHSELLDRAVWRRFQLRLMLPKPSKRCIAEYFERLGQRLRIEWQYSVETLSEKLYGASFGELEEFGFDVVRRHVLSVPNGQIRTIVRDCLDEWHDRLKAKDKAEV